MLLIGSAAVAAGVIPGADGVIHGCYNAKNGILRVIDPDVSSCKRSEQMIAWNERGPEGPPGPEGPKGEPGAVAFAGQTCADAEYLQGFDADGNLLCQPLPVTQPSDPDADADGYTASAGGDCDDTNAAVHPGATEVADGLDNDCDGSVDEGTDTCAEDGFEENDSKAAAADLGTVNEGATRTFSGQVCSGDDDWFRIRAMEVSSNCFPNTDEDFVTTFTLTFQNSAGNLDLQVHQVQSSGATSTASTTNDSETITWTADGACGAEDNFNYHIRVYGYEGAENSYTLSVRHEEAP